MSLTYSIIGPFISNFEFNIIRIKRSDENTSKALKLGINFFSVEACGIIAWNLFVL